MEYYIPGAQVRNANGILVPQPYVTGAFILNTIQYPADWLRKVGDAERDAIGAVPRPTPGRGEAVDKTPNGWVIRPMTEDEWAELLAAERAEVLAKIDEKARQLREAGAPYMGKIIDFHTEKEWNRILAMTVSAYMATSGFLPWPEEYQLGWITRDNSRIPLPLPTDGMSLASRVIDWENQITNNARNLKDRVNAGEEVDIQEGWPED